MPSKDVFADRGRTLENEFFRRVDQELIRKLKQKADTESGRERLGQVTGIADQAVLKEILDTGIQADTLVALTLVPLVQVAWADPIIDSAECEAVLEAAEASGVAKETASYQLLSNWLRNKPEPNLFGAWKKYMAELRKVLEPERFQQLRDDVTNRAREVAKESGGFLGIGRITDAERAVLNEITQAFDN